jgi:hypothetical protein
MPQVRYSADAMARPGLYPQKCFPFALLFGRALFVVIKLNLLLIGQSRPGLSKDICSPLEWVECAELP